MEKRKIVAIAVLICYFVILAGCGSNLEDNNDNDAVHSELSDSRSNTESEETEINTSQEPTVVNGVLRYVFPYNKKMESKPVLKIGVIMDDGMARRGRSLDDTWEVWAQELNHYLEKKGMDYQAVIYLFSFGAYSEEEAISQGLSAECDIVCGNVSELKSLDLEGSFEDLEDILKEGELQSIYEFFPQKYWEYMKMQYSGIYNLVQEVALLGGAAMHVNTGFLEEYGYQWNKEDGINRSFEEWEQIVESIYNQKEGKGILHVYNMLVGGLLSFLIPETEYQLMAPGVGINLKTGEAEKILDNPVIQERIAKICEWYEKGYIFTSSTGQNSLFSYQWRSTTGYSEYNGQSGEEDWCFPIVSMLYYPISLHNMYGTKFCGIAKDTEKKELAIQLLKDCEEDEVLQHLLSQGQRWLVLTPRMLYYEEMNDIGSTTYYVNGQPVSRAEAAYEDYENAMIPAVCGFHFDKTAVSEEIEALKRVAVNAKEANLEFDNFDTWEQDLEQLKIDLAAAGIDRVLEELQRQLQEGSVK